MRQANAGVGIFGVPDLARFVDLIAPQSNIGGGWSTVASGNSANPIATIRLYLSPLLSRVVFVGQAALRLRVDFQRIGQVYVKMENFAR